MAKVGYARVSTYKQEKYGGSLKNQIQQLKKAGCTKIFSEQFTGTKLKRPEFQRLLKYLRAGDTLYCVKLDRLGRDMRDIVNVVHNLTKKHIKIFILSNNLVLDNKSVMGKAMLGMLSTFAGLERDMIVSRMKAGKSYAYKYKGKKALGGRPRRLNSKKMKHYLAIYQIFKEHKHLKQKDPEYYSKLYNKPVYKEVAELGNCSVQTVYNVIKDCKQLSKTQIEQLKKKD